MKIKVLVKDITSLKTDGIIIGLFEDEKKLNSASAAIDKALEGAITNLIKTGEVKGKLNELTIIHSLGRIQARVIAIAGLGKKLKYEIDTVRQVTGQACRALQKTNCHSIGTVIHGAGVNGLNSVLLSQSIVEGAILGLYSYRKHFTTTNEYKDINELVIADSRLSALVEIKKACHHGQIVAEATNFARDLVNEPANYMTPGDIVTVAQKLASKYSLALTVMERRQMEKEGMGALLAVAQGSNQPPKFLIIKYQGDAKSAKTIGFIGKGITFDSGGISLKSSENMQDMKGDMAGAAAVLAAISAIAGLKLRMNVTAVIAATENLPSGQALKPGDVIKALTGKTIEVVNTDAEGRLTLADALGYAVKQGYSPLIDVATLTGSCQVALGDVCSGIFTNNQDFADKILQASEIAGEYLWQLPMKDEYKELNKSDVADIKNSGGKYGGAIAAALFLAEFVGDIPWVHIDIAGTAMIDKDKGYIIKGATGVTVRTLVKLAEILAS